MARATRSFIFQHCGGPRRTWECHFAWRFLFAPLRLCARFSCTRLAAPRPQISRLPSAGRAVTDARGSATKGPTMLRRILLGFLALVVVAAVSLAVWEPLNAEAPPAPTFQPADVRLDRDGFGVPPIFVQTHTPRPHGDRNS